MTPFQLAVKFTLDHEGRYVFNPKDPGGETNYGIAKKSHPDVDITNLTIAGAMEIYKREYWDAYSLDPIPLPLCIAYFDSYVQHSPNSVRKMIEIGNGDLRAFIEARRQYYKRVEQNNPKTMVFDKGWMNRCNDLFKYCQIVMQDQI